VNPRQKHFSDGGDGQEGAMLRELTDADFTREVVESRRPYVVLFSSSWCGMCAKVAPRLHALAEQHRETRFGKVDIAVSAKTAAAFGVLAIPAVLFFRDGAEKARLSGNVSDDELARALETLA
jgi:thioredoxin-like negative regulator of GroEL